MKLHVICAAAMATALAVCQSPFALALDKMPVLSQMGDEAGSAEAPARRRASPKAVGALCIAPMLNISFA